MTITVPVSQVCSAISTGTAIPACAKDLILNVLNNATPGGLSLLDCVTNPTAAIAFFKQLACLSAPKSLLSLEDVSGLAGIPLALAAGILA